MNYLDCIFSCPVNEYNFINVAISGGGVCMCPSTSRFQEQTAVIRKVRQGQTKLFSINLKLSALTPEEDGGDERKSKAIIE